MLEVVLAVVLTVLLIGSYTDLKKREIADWLNYGLVIFGVGVNFLQSLIFWNWTYAVYSITGLLIFFGIAYAMFYAGQWGGGDSKLLIGLGAVFGLPFMVAFPYIRIESFIVSFWFNLLLAGMVYALLWSIYLAISNRRKFVKEMKTGLKQRARIRKMVVIASGLALIAALVIPDTRLKILVFSFALLVILSLYITVFSKAVERAGMLKMVKPNMLTEGDWVAKDVVVDGRKITGPKDLGVSKKQILKLVKLYDQKKIRKILIKNGIPFVPSFLFAFILTIMYGNVLRTLLQFG